jgi:hypothetical protein
MVDERYSSWVSSEVDSMIKREVERVKFAVFGVAPHIAGLETDLEKTKKAMGWKMIGYYHRN